MNERRSCHSFSIVSVEQIIICDIHLNEEQAFEQHFYGLFVHLSRYLDEHFAYHRIENNEKYLNIDHVCFIQFLHTYR